MGSRLADVARWREILTKTFVDLAVEVAMKDAEQEAARRVLPAEGYAREFVIDDCAEAVKLWKQSDGIVLRDADKRPVARCLRQNKGTSWVWEKDGHIRGAVLAGTDGRREFLHHLAVHKEHRRRGVGGALVEHALVAFAKLGIEKTHVMVEAENATARHFWTRLGWVERTDVMLMSYATNSTA